MYVCLINQDKFNGRSVTKTRTNPIVDLIDQDKFNGIASLEHKIIPYRYIDI